MEEIELKPNITNLINKLKTLNDRAEIHKFRIEVRNKFGQLVIIESPQDEA